MVQPAEIRFYFDADVLGLAKVVVRFRPDVTYPGDPGAWCISETFPMSGQLNG